MKRKKESNTDDSLEEESDDVLQEEEEESDDEEETVKTERVLPHIKPHLSHTSNGADIIRFEFKGLMLDKLFNEELFYIQSVIKSIERAIGHKLSGINSFTSSYTFHKQLSLLDNSVNCCGNVYMKRGKQKGTTKI